MAVFTLILSKYKNSVHHIMHQNSPSEYSSVNKKMLRSTNSYYLISSSVYVKT